MVWVILTVKDFVATAPHLSVTFRANVYVPAVLGVPDNVALLPENVSLVFGGSVPLVFDQVNAEVPPLTIMLLLYPALRTPLGNVLEIDGLAAMVRLSDFVVLPAPLVALTVKDFVPAVVGVPVILPLFRVRFAGSVPLEMLHVIVPAPDVLSEAL